MIKAAVYFVVVIKSWKTKNLVKNRSNAISRKNMLLKLLRMMPGRMTTNEFA